MNTAVPCPGRAADTHQLTAEARKHTSTPHPIIDVPRSIHPPILTSNSGTLTSLRSTLILLFIPSTIQLPPSSPAWADSSLAPVAGALVAALSPPPATPRPSAWTTFRSFVMLLFNRSEISSSFQITGREGGGGTHMYSCMDLSAKLNQKVFCMP